MPITNFFKKLMDMATQKSQGAGIVEEVPPSKAGEASPNYTSLDRSYGEKLSECSFTSTFSQDSSFRSAVSRLKTADDTDTTADFESAGEEDYSGLNISRLPLDCANSELWFQSLEYYNGSATPSVNTGGREAVGEVTLSPEANARDCDLNDVTLRPNSDDSPQSPLERSGSSAVIEAADRLSFGNITPIKSFSSTTVNTEEISVESSRNVAFDSFSKTNCDIQQTCDKEHADEISVAPIDILNPIDCQSSEKNSLEQNTDVATKKSKDLYLSSLNNGVVNEYPHLDEEQVESSQGIVTIEVETSFSESVETPDNKQDQLVDNNFDDLIDRLSQINIKNDSVRIASNDQIHTVNLSTNLVSDGENISLKDGSVNIDNSLNIEDISTHNIKQNSNNPSEYLEEISIDNIESSNLNCEFIIPIICPQVSEKKDLNFVNEGEKFPSCDNDSYLTINESFNENCNTVIVPEENFQSHSLPDSGFIETEYLDGKNILGNSIINSDQSQNQIISEVTKENTSGNEVILLDASCENGILDNSAFKVCGKDDPLLVKETDLTFDIETDFKSYVLEPVSTDEKKLSVNELEIDVNESVTKDKELETVIILEEFESVVTSSNDAITTINESRNNESFSFPNDNIEEVETELIKSDFQSTEVISETLNGELVNVDFIKVNDFSQTPDIPSSTLCLPEKDLIDVLIGNSTVNEGNVSFIENPIEVITDKVELFSSEITEKSGFEVGERLTEAHFFQSDKTNGDNELKNNIDSNKLVVEKDTSQSVLLPQSEILSCNENNIFFLESQNYVGEISEDIQIDVNGIDLDSANYLENKEHSEIKNLIEHTTFDLIDNLSDISEPITIDNNHDFENEANLIPHLEDVTVNNNNLLGIVDNDPDFENLISNVNVSENNAAEDSFFQLFNNKTLDSVEINIGKMEKTFVEKCDFKDDSEEVNKDSLGTLKEYEESLISTDEVSQSYQTKVIGMDSLIGNLQGLCIDNPSNVTLTLDKEDVSITRVEDNEDNVSEISSTGSPPDMLNNMTEEEMGDLLSTPRYPTSDTAADLLMLSFNNLRNYLPSDSLPDMKPNLDLNTTEAGPVTASDDMQAGELNQVISDTDIDIASLKRRVEESDQNNQSLLNHFDPLSDAPINVKDNQHNDSLFGNSRARVDEVEITPVKDHHIGLLVPVTPLPENDLSPGASVPDSGGCHTPVTTTKMSMKKLADQARSPMQEALAKELTKLQEAMMERQRVHEARLLEMKLKVDEAEKKREMKMARLKELEAKQPRHAHVKLDKLTADNATLKEANASLKKRTAELFGVLDGYEKAMPRLVNQREGKKKVMMDEVRVLLSERNTAQQHVANMETALNDTHQKYERSIKAIEEFKLNQDKKVEGLRERCEQIEAAKERYLKLLAHATQRLEDTNSDRNTMMRSHETEVARTKAIIQQKELKIRSNNVTIEQKQKELKEMTKIYDELLRKLN